MTYGLFITQHNPPHCAFVPLDDETYGWAIDFNLQTTELLLRVVSTTVKKELWEADGADLRMRISLLIPLDMLTGG